LNIGRITEIGKREGDFKGAGGLQEVQVMGMDVLSVALDDSSLDDVLKFACEAVELRVCLNAAVSN
jgi:hypothetical protein